MGPRGHAGQDSPAGPPATAGRHRDHVARSGHPRPSSGRGPARDGGLHRGGRSSAVSGAAGRRVPADLAAGQALLQHRAGGFVLHTDGRHFAQPVHELRGDQVPGPAQLPVPGLRPEGHGSAARRPGGVLSPGEDPRAAFAGGREDPPRRPGRNAGPQHRTGSAAFGRAPDHLYEAPFRHRPVPALGRRTPGFVGSGPLAGRAVHRIGHDGYP